MKFSIFILAFLMMGVGCVADRQNVYPEVMGIPINNEDGIELQNEEAVEEPGDMVSSSGQIAPEYVGEVEDMQVEDLLSQSDVKVFQLVARQWEFEPSEITVNVGDTVRLIVTSVDVNHGISISEFGVNERLAPGETVVIEFVADQSGTFSYFCNVMCGVGHNEMIGTFTVL